LGSWETKQVEMQSVQPYEEDVKFSQQNSGGFLLSDAVASGLSHLAPLRVVTHVRMKERIKRLQGPVWILADEAPAHQCT
jgi:hypothetical protein